MRVISMCTYLSGAAAFGLLVVWGCGGSGNGTKPPSNPDLPALVAAPNQFATFGDGSRMLLSVVREGGGKLDGVATLYGSSPEDPPVAFVVDGSLDGTQAKLKLASSAENNMAADYLIEGKMDSDDDEIHGQLLAGPDASPGDLSPQAAEFHDTSTTSPPTTAGIDSSYVTLKLGSRGQTPVYRLRLQRGKQTNEFHGTFDYDIGYRLCLQPCEDKFTDYATIYASYWDQSPETLTVRVFTEHGLAASMYFYRKNTAEPFNISNGIISGFMHLNPDGSKADGFSAISEVSGPLVLP